MKKGGPTTIPPSTRPRPLAQLALHMSTASTALLQGWLTGAGLIVAIGAQNALVLRQGLMRQHVAPVVMVCALSDVLLIVVGVFGLGSLVAASPLLMTLFRYGGAAFLLAYAFAAGRRALAPKAGLQAQVGSASLGTVLGSTLAMTYLNPHVYLDTVVLLGTLGAQQPQASRVPFAAGAGLASVMWFSLLGFGAAAVAAPLRRAAVWRGIDAVIALVMAWLGLQLLLRPLG